MPDLVAIIVERMESFFRDPLNYEGPFSGITYRDVVWPSGVPNTAMPANMVPEGAD
jgi:hypothetical protein